MSAVYTAAPAKVIICGDHGVNRNQAALSTAVDMHTACRVTEREDGRFLLRSGDREALYERGQLDAFKAEVDELRKAQKLDEIREHARDFFAPTRYVLAYALDRTDTPGLDIEWRSCVPVSSGLGSGAAASASMALGAFTLVGYEHTADDLIEIVWQGDIIAHGGLASSLDSSTIIKGGLIRYTVVDGASVLPFDAALPIVIGNVFVHDRSTARLNTKVRKWLEAHPSRMHLFQDMGYLVEGITRAIERKDLPDLGHLWNLHQLIQDKIGTSAPENERLIEAAIGAGALGAKIAGAGGGGIIIALAEQGRLDHVASAISDAGGESYIVRTGSRGLRIVDQQSWEKYTHK